MPICPHTEPTLEPQLPETDFRDMSEQPSEQEQVSCPVLDGETADEVGNNMATLTWSIPYKVMYT